MENIQISIESTCPSCDYPIKVVAEVYKVHNRDGSLHNCTLTDKEKLEKIICRYGYAMRISDWTVATKAHQQILEHFKLED